MGINSDRTRVTSESNTRVVSVLDREGDITEVFDAVRQLKRTGVKRGSGI